MPAKAEPLRQPANVRVHWKCVFGAEMDANDTGCLVTDAGQGFQLLAGFRNLPLMPIDKNFGGGDQIARLAAVEATALDQSFQLGDFSARVALGGGIAAKQSGRDQVDSSVRALRGQDDGNQQLQRSPMVQLDFRARHMSVQPVDDRYCSLALGLLGLSRHAGV